MGGGMASLLDSLSLCRQGRGGLGVVGVPGRDVHSGYKGGHCDRRPWAIRGTKLCSRLRQFCLLLMLLASKQASA